MDGLVNVITGLGTKRDKRGYGQYLTNVISDFEAREMWRCNAIAARVIELLPREMYREGYDVEIPEERDLSDEICGALKDLRVDEQFRRAGEFERAYGGAGIFPEINDGQGDLAQPLNESRIVSVGRLHLYEPQEMQPDTWGADGEPEVWLLCPVGRRYGVPHTRIHRSRFITWPGIRVTNEQSHGTRDGWGDSILTRVLEALRDYDTAFGSAAILTSDFAHGVHKISGLAELASSNADNIIKKRIEILDMMRSVLRASVIDKEDEYKREQTPVSGLDSLLRELAVRLAAAADYPVTVLFGVSPAGLNATGESDTRLMYDRTSAAQDRELPRLERLVRLLLLSRMGPTNGKLPDGYRVTWKPLWQPSQKEQVETRKLQADIDAAYLDRGVLTPEEVTESRFGGATYSHETKVDTGARRELEALEPDKATLPPADTEPKGGKSAAGAELAAKEGVKPGEVKYFQYEIEGGVVTVNEVRQSKGLGAHPSGDGDLTLPAFKAKHMELFARAAVGESPSSAEKVLGMNEPEPAPAPPGAPGRAPFGKKPPTPGPTPPPGATGPGAGGSPEPEPDEDQDDDGLEFEDDEEEHGDADFEPNRDEAGKFAPGGSGGKGKDSPHKNASHKQLFESYERLSGDPAHAPGPANEWKGSKELRAVTKEAKSRGLGTVTKLARAARSDGSRGR